MLLHSLFVVLFLCFVESVFRNVTCPDVEPRELDWKELDGKWYLAASAAKIQIQGECAIIRFSHIKNNATEISISWVSNKTASYYNGSLAIIEDPKSNGTGDLMAVTYQDGQIETYSFLDVEYGHYAVMFACYNNEDGNSSTYKSEPAFPLKVTLVGGSNSSVGVAKMHPVSLSKVSERKRPIDELWKLSRTPHLKEDSSEKINKALTKYELLDTPFDVYRNTDEYCAISGVNVANPSSVVMSLVAAITLFRRLY